VEIFDGTVRYVQSNGYNVGEKYIAIDNNVIFSEYFKKPEKLRKTGVCETMFSVINADCLEAAEILLNSGFNPCVLNLANDLKPGGGVLNGAGAQEENLFRRTNLFMSLFQFSSYVEDYGLLKKCRQLSSQPGCWRSLLRKHHSVQSISTQRISFAE
jgi:Uncharacterized protein conserved in bacteria